MALMLVQPAVPCTTFVTTGPDGPIFGRNYDFEFGEALVVVNPRGQRKEADVADPEPKAAWVARHGSLTFNQFGVGFPTGGVNEVGLVVELMWLDGTRYPAADGRPAVATLQFIQYLLDRAGTLDEALQAAAEVRIAGRTPLHFLVADARGRTATVEFLDGRLVVHEGQRLPVRVLTNDTYASSLDHLKRYRSFGGSEATPQDGGSLSRFARAAEALQRGSGSVTSAFQTLEAVAQPGYTHWQIVYEPARGRIHYRTAAQRELRQVDLARIDFACRAGLRVMNVDSGRGDVSMAWQPYTQAVNEAQLLTAYRKTSFLKNVPEAVPRAEAAYPASMRCDAGTS
jgi:penicillin V acylase-like amidase (Ntn superfamily)